MWELMEMAGKTLERLVLYFLICVCMLVLAALLMVLFVYGDSYVERIDFYQSIDVEAVTQDGVLNMLHAIGYFDIIIRSMFKIIGLLSVLYLVGLYFIVFLWKSKEVKRTG